MSSVVERGHAVAREIIERRDPYGTELRDNTFLQAALAEAFARGAMWGIERTQYAVAITHARYRTELDSEGDRP